MYLFQSSGELAVLFNRKNAKFILDELKKTPGEILQKEDDLSILIVNTPPRMVDIPGVMYYLTGLIARGGITLIDIISTFTEIIFAVRAVDGIKIFEILESAIKDARKNLEARNLWFFILKQINYKIKFLNSRHLQIRDAYMRDMNDWF